MSSFNEFEKLRARVRALEVRFANMKRPPVRSFQIILLSSRYQRYMNVGYLPLTSLGSKQVIRERSALVEFTEEGRIAVIANMLCGPTHDTLIRARDLLLQCSKEDNHSWEVNSILCSSVYALGSMLDAIAKACQVSANDGSSAMNFQEYGFGAVGHREIRSVVDNIRRVEFNNKPFNYWLNRCKHELPWTGVPTQHHRHGCWDIHEEKNLGEEGTDLEGNENTTKGFLVDVLKVVFDNALSIVHKLGQDHESLKHELPTITI